MSSIARIHRLSHCDIAPSGRPSAQCGFSLIETLVAILLLSLSVLGAVGLQATALQSNRDARDISIALTLAGELADMMRSNRVVASSADTNPYIGTFTSPITPTTSQTCLHLTSATPCTDSTQVAQAQMTDWLARVDAQLPGARVAVCRNAAPYSSTGIPVWPSSCSAAGSGVFYIQIGWDVQSTNTSGQRTSANGAAWLRATKPSIVVPVLTG